MPRKTKTKRQLSRGKCVRVPPAVLVPEDFNGGNLQRISVRRQRRKCTSEEVKICSSLVHVLKSFGVGEGILHPPEDSEAYEDKGGSQSALAAGGLRPTVSMGACGCLRYRSSTWLICLLNRIVFWIHSVVCVC